MLGEASFKNKLIELEAVKKRYQKRRHTNKNSRKFNHIFSSLANSCEPSSYSKMIFTYLVKGS